MKARLKGFLIVSMFVVSVIFSIFATKEKDFILMGCAMFAGFSSIYFAISFCLEGLIELKKRITKLEDDK